MPDETRALARFAAELKSEQIPARVRERATDILVDQIGNQIGCSDLPWARQVRGTYSRAGGAPEATVVRYGDRLPAGSAAFINSTFGHSFEYDDANPLIHGHPGAELIPSLLAIGEREHSTGEAFLTAFIAAYEVRGRIGWAISPDTVERGGPQQSTTCGPFGVATGVARLLGLGTEGIRDALGIAGTFSGGLKQYDHGGGSAKRLYAAVAASSGIQSAQLAEAGISGPEQILEGKRGLLRLYASTYRPEVLVFELGRKWTMEHVLFKPYCCCAVIHPAIDGLKALLSEHDVGANQIECIDVGYPKGLAEHAAIVSPKDLLGMQFSTAYSLALTILKGRNTPREYTAETLSDARVMTIAERIRLHEDTELRRLTEQGHFPAHVELRLRDGRVYRRSVIDARGSPGAPLSSGDIDEKFRSQVSDVLGPAHCNEVLQALRGIERLGDVASLPPLLVARK